MIRPGIATNAAFYGDDNACEPFLTGPLQSATKLIGPVAGDRILIIGCGERSSLEHRLSECGARVVGIDVSLKAVMASNGRGRRISYLQADGNVLPFATASFDLTISVSTLQYMDIPSAISECGRVLRGGGRAIFIENLASCPLAKLDRLRRKLTAKTSEPGMAIRRHFSFDDLRYFEQYFSFVHVNVWHDWSTLIYPLVHGRARVQRLLKSVVRNFARPVPPSVVRAHLSWLAEVVVRRRETSFQLPHLKKEPGR